MYAGARFTKIARRWHRVAVRSELREDRITQKDLKSIVGDRLKAKADLKS
jgi:hypothetical protein